MYVKDVSNTIRTNNSNAQNIFLLGTVSLYPFLKMSQLHFRYVTRFVVLTESINV